jgi:hypothetical protein
VVEAEVRGRLPPGLQRVGSAQQAGRQELPERRVLAEHAERRERSALDEERGADHRRHRDDQDPVLTQQAGQLLGERRTRAVQILLIGDVLQRLEEERDAVATRRQPLGQLVHADPGVAHDRRVGEPAAVDHAVRYLDEPSVLIDRKDLGEILCERRLDHPRRRSRNRSPAWTRRTAAPPAARPRSAWT